MSKSQKRVWMAIAIGSSISITLCLASYAAHSSFLTRLQTPGFLVCIWMRGLESATKADVAEIAVPINAAIYAVIVFALLYILAQVRNSK